MPAFADLCLTPIGGLDPWLDTPAALDADAALQAALSADPQLVSLFLLPRHSRDAGAAAAPVPPAEVARWKSLQHAVAAHARDSGAAAAPVAGLSSARELQFLLGSPRRLSRRMFRVVHALPTSGTPARPRRVSATDADADISAMSAPGTDELAEFAPPSCAAWRLGPLLPARAVRILDRLRRAYWSAVVGVDGVSDASAPRGGDGVPDSSFAGRTAQSAPLLAAASSHGLFDPQRFFSHALPAALALLAAVQIEGNCGFSQQPMSPIRPLRPSAGAVVSAMPAALQQASEGGAVAGDGPGKAPTPLACDALQSLAARTDVLPWWPGSQQVLPADALADCTGGGPSGGVSAPLLQLGARGAAALCRDFLSDVLVVKFEGRSSIEGPAPGAVAVPAAAEAISLRSRVLPKRLKRKRSGAVSAMGSGGEEAREAASLDLIARMPLRLVILQIMLRLQIAAMAGPEVPGDPHSAAEAAPFDATARLLVESASASVCLLGRAELARLAFLAATGEASLQRALLTYVTRTPFGARLPRSVAAAFQAAGIPLDEAEAALELEGPKRALILAALDRERARRRRPAALLTIDSAIEGAAAAAAAPDDAGADPDVPPPNASGSSNRESRGDAEQLPTDDVWPADRAPTPAAPAAVPPDPLLSRRGAALVQRLPPRTQGGGRPGTAPLVAAAAVAGASTSKGVGAPPPVTDALLLVSQQRARSRASALAAPRRSAAAPTVLIDVRKGLSSAPTPRR